MFSFLSPEATPLDVEDIAYSLSNLCRFTGHTSEFYSVAQHAVLVSYLVDPHHAFHALHHDDVEAVMGDVSSPLKGLLPQYKELETRIEAEIFKQLGLPPEIPFEVKQADLMVLRTEQRDLMRGNFHACVAKDNIAPLRIKIFPVSPQRARIEFLRRHQELMALRTAG